MDGFLFCSKDDKRREFSVNNMDKLIDQYVDVAINSGKAKEEGDYKSVNSYYDIIQRIRIEMKKDPQYVVKLEPLLQHDNEYVRLEAAFDLLPILTERAENVLSELSKKRGLNGFEAEMTLQEWKKGNLRF